MSNLAHRQPEICKMANEAQRTRRGARRRRKLLSGLVLASGCINLAALCCMMLFMCAGLYYSSWDTQALGYFDHPGDDNIAYREFAMVQVNRPLPAIASQLG